MGRWGDGEMGSVEEIKKYISSPLPCRTTKIYTNPLINCQKKKTFNFGNYLTVEV